MFMLIYALCYLPGHIVHGIIIPRSRRRRRVSPPARLSSAPLPSSFSASVLAEISNFARVSENSPRKSRKLSCYPCYSPVVAE